LTASKVEKYSYKVKITISHYGVACSADFTSK